LSVAILAQARFAAFLADKDVIFRRKKIPFDIERDGASRCGP